MEIEVKRFTFGLLNNPLEATQMDEGEWVRYSDHHEIVVNLEHERKFWAWKYECREAECEELAERIKKLDPDGILEQ